MVEERVLSNEELFFYNASASMEKVNFGNTSLSRKKKGFIVL